MEAGWVKKGTARVQASIPMPATWVTLAPPKRSAAGPAATRAMEPTSGPRKA